MNDSYETGSSDEDLVLDSLEGVIETVGISSGVVESDEDGDHEVIGHVLLLDYDGADPIEMRSEVEELPGIVALFESSPGSFHAWCLSIESDLDDQLLRALRTRTDAQHVQSSAKRGYYVLRLGPKVRAESRETYKPAPELIDVWVSEAELPQSWGHWQLLRDRIGESDHVEVDPDSIEELVDEWQGDRVIQSSYLTMTDDLKEEI